MNNFKTKNIKLSLALYTHTPKKRTQFTHKTHQDTSDLRPTPSLTHSLTPFGVGV